MHDFMVLSRDVFIVEQIMSLCEVCFNPLMSYGTAAGLFKYM